MNHCMFDRDEDRDEPYKIFERESERSATIKARRLAWLHRSIDENDQYDGRKSEPIFGNEDCQRSHKKKQQSTRLWLLSWLFSCDLVHWYMHSQPMQKGSSSWNKLNNKPDWFLCIFQSCWLRCNNTVDIVLSYHTRHLPFHKESRQYTSNGCCKGILSLML